MRLWRFGKTSKRSKRMRPPRTPKNSARTSRASSAVRSTNAFTISSNSAGFHLCAHSRNDSVSSMRIEIVNDAGGPAPGPTFPPGDNYVDLRQNPHAVEQSAAAREYLPLRNFLVAVNSPESLFASASRLPPNMDRRPAAGGDHEFISRTIIVFAAASLNFDRGHYVELATGLKELLERDPGDSSRGVLQISPCDFVDQNERGYCLKIQLTAKGDSSSQAELRWGLGLAFALQRALLFRARRPWTTDRCLRSFQRYIL